jgi:hypothetical protein
MPSSSTSNFTCWMCMPCAITLLPRASIYSYRLSKLMLSSSSSSSTYVSSNVVAFSISWLKILSHSSECSSFSSAWEASNVCSNSSSLTVSASYLTSVVVASTSVTQISASPRLCGRNIGIPPIIRRLL